jgi:hypothetical protein
MRSQLREQKTLKRNRHGANRKLNFELDTIALGRLG